MKNIQYLFILLVAVVTAIFCLMCSCAGPKHISQRKPIMVECFLVKESACNEKECRIVSAMDDSHVSIYGQMVIKGDTVCGWKYDDGDIVYTRLNREK